MIGSLAFLVSCFLLAALSPFWGYVGLLGNTIFRVQDREPSMAGWPVFSILFLPLLVTTVRAYDVPPKLKYRQDAIAWLFVAIVAAGLLVNNPGALPREMLGLVACLSYYYFASRAVTSRRKLSILLASVALLVLVAGAESLSAFYFSGDPRFLNHHGRLQGVGYWDNPNQFGNLMLLGIAFAVGLTLAAGNVAARLAGCAAVLVMAWVVVLSMSRTCAVTLAIMAVLFGITNARNGIAAKLLAAAATAALLGLALSLAPADFRERLYSIQERGTDPSYLGRTEAWRIGSELALASPLTGVGKGQWSNHHDLAPHNTLVHVAAETGFAGLACYLALLSLGLWPYLRLYRARGRVDRSYWHLATAVVIATIGLQIYGLFGVEAWAPISYFLFGLLAALFTLPAAHQERSVSKVRAGDQPSGRDPRQARAARDFVFLSSDDWGWKTSKYHLATRLARHNRVLFVSSIGFRPPDVSARDARRIVAKLASFLDGPRQVRDNLHVLTPLALPFAPGPIEGLNRRLVGIQLRRAIERLDLRAPCVLAFSQNWLPHLEELQRSSLIYYCVDEHSAFSRVDRQRFQALDDRMARAADAVVCASHRLYEKNAARNANTHLVPHGVDWSLFASALDASPGPPSELKGLQRPILLFFGHISDDWVDLRLLEHIAREQPEWSIVLVGRSAIEPRAFPQLANVHWLGERDIESLPALCREADVGLVPFVDSELTRASHPLKVLEYLAAGLPVVSTEIPEIRRLYSDQVRLASDPREFVAQCEAALGEGSSDDRQRRSANVRDQDWERTVESLLAIVEKSDDHP